MQIDRERVSVVDMLLDALDNRSNRYLYIRNTDTIHLTYMSEPN